MIRSCSVGLSDQRSRINSDKVQTPAEEIAELHRMNRCMVTGVSGWHRINRPWGIGAICRACLEKAKRHRMIRRVQMDEHRTKGRIVYQRACQRGIRETLQDRMIRSPVGVMGRTIRRPPRQQFSMFENSTTIPGL